MSYVLEHFLDDFTSEQVNGRARSQLTDYYSEISPQAQSPDENALVSAARNFGLVFTERTQDSITILNKGEVGVFIGTCSFPSFAG